MGDYTNKQLEDLLVKKELELQEVKKALAISQEQYSGIYNNAPMAFQSLDEEGYVIDINPQWLSILDYKKEDVIGKWFGEFLQDDFIDHFKKNFPQFKKQGYVNDVRFKMKKSNGDPIFVSYEGCIGLHKDGSFKQTYCTFKDVTVEQEAKTKLINSEEKFRNLFNQSNIGIAIADVNGKIIDVNNGFLKILDYSREEFLDKTFIELTHPEDISLEIKEYNRIVSGEIDNYRLSKRLINKKGESIWNDAAIAAKRNEANEIEMIFSMSIDINEAKKDKELLIKSEIKYRTLFNGIGDAVFVQKYNANKFTPFIEVNDVACKRYGYTPKELCKLTVLDISANTITFEERENLLNRNWQTHETLHKTKNGNIIPVEVSSHIFDVQGEKHVLCLVRDITDRKKTQQKILDQNTQLKHINDELKIEKENAEKANNLKTEFLHNMSHEIRTPMNGIVGFCNMLTDENISNKKKEYFAKIIQNSSKQLLRVIDDILEISTLETKQIKLNETSFSLNDFIMESFSVFSLKAKSKSLPLYVKKELNDDESYITCDKSKLSKIISNLLENAFKFTYEGYIEFGYKVENKNLIIYVKDTGTGISEENKEKIFERFSQENKEISKNFGGLGLGLSISKENAQLLGGDITLESKQGEGTTFKLTIPHKIAAYKKDQNIEKPQNSNNLNKELKTILIAEDEEVNYLFLEAVIENHYKNEYKLIHAINGKDALDHCTTNQNIKIVLMDIKMPVMSGHEATEKIKKINPNIPVIAQTAYSTEADKKLAFKHGCDDFISKPINKNKLISLINSYIK